MIGRAACRGAATIVNAIPTGRGAAFGITLEADALVELKEGQRDIRASGNERGPNLLENCVRSTLAKAGFADLGGSVRVVSDIPVSRGLKSSSAVSNAVVLATATAAKSDLGDHEIIEIAVSESINAGVTVTGAFDDAAACFLGGAVVTDNPARRVLARGVVDPSLAVIVHVPDRKILKSDVMHLDFSRAKPRVEEALRLALAGEYLKAMELNSSACSRILDVSEDAVDLARANGALAAGISGTGPSTVALAKREDAEKVRGALESLGGTVILAEINDTNAREVAPRLL